MITGTNNGRVQLRLMEVLEKFMEIPMHGTGGAITSAQMSPSDKLVFSTASDGTLFLRQLDIDQIVASAKGMALPDPCVHKRAEQGIVLIDLTRDLSALIGNEIEDPSIYSLQQAKLKTEEDKQEMLAEQHKEIVRKKVRDLVVEFDTMRKEQDKLESWFRLDENEFIVDPE